MSASETDVKLSRFLNMLEPEQLDRLKILVDARTAAACLRPTLPTDGPETYRGVPVPEGLRPNWDQLEVSWWRLGVNAALDTAVPLLDELHNDEPCALDHHGYCQVHGLPQPGPCPDGEIQEFIAATKEGGTT